MKGKPKVLIAYYSGSKERGRRPPPLDAGPVDTITYPTPQRGAGFVALLIAESLRKAGAEAVLKSVEECKDPREIVAADALVVGTPVYFGDMVWQVKRFFDVVLYRIFVHRKGRLSDKVACAFTSGGSLKDAEWCLKILERALSYLRPRMVSGLATSPWMSEADLRKGCEELARRLLEALGVKRS